MKNFIKKPWNIVKKSIGSSGAIIISVSICMLAYLVILNFYILHKTGDVAEFATVLSFASDVSKYSLIIIAAAVFLYTFSVSDYQSIFGDLVEMFSADNPIKDSQGSNPYSQNESIDKLLESANVVIEANLHYKSQLDRQKELMLENQIMRLMKGRVRDIPSAYESATTMGINLKAESYIVVSFMLDNDASDLCEETVLTIHNSTKALIKAMLFAAFDGYITEVDGMVAALVMSQKGGDSLCTVESKTELKRITTLISHIILERYEHSLRIAVGSSGVGIAGIEQSFSESLELLQYAEITGDSDSVLVYQNMPMHHMVDTDDYFFFKKEIQFMNCINAEDYNSAATIFNEILDSEYIRSDLPIKLANCRMLGLINSMINALGKIRLTMDADYFERLNPWEAILSCKSISELRKCSTEIFDSINYYTENQKKLTPYDRMADIIAYLKENYSDPNLSVATVADNFELNSSYLSRIFKKLMGIGLAEYIQRIRINEAVELMKDKTISVKDVSERVGYSSVLTMNRAFKKYEGTTAGKLRNIDTEEN